MAVSLKNLTLEQKVGQFFCIGLAGTEADADTKALLRHVTPGGIIMFGRNVASIPQLRSLNDSLRAMLPVTPMIGIDQEGGLVDRLRRILTPMPSARTIRQHGDLAGARTLGRITGEALLMLGFNLNFAPVMSIMTDDRDLLSNGLYSRSYGRSPGEVLGYTMVYLRGLQGTGCMGCLKHFPGIGSGEVDSHEEMPIVRLTHDDLLAQDLAPYIELFQRADDRVRAVMVSHGGFPNIDITQGVAGGPIQPASLNHGITTTLLRDELGYKNLVVTDDLEMGAISKHCEIEEAVIRAFQAGQDVMLICSRPDLIERGYNHLLQAVKQGEITEERVNLSLKRIEDFKNLLHDPPAFEPGRLDLLSKEIQQLNAKLNYTYGGKI